VFIVPADIHPNMEHKESEIEQLRLLAGRLSADWRIPGGMAAPALARCVCFCGFWALAAAAPGSSQRYFARISLLSTDNSCSS
jgi:hypothetical protein